MSAEPKYVALTLAWCNARRKEREKRALKKMPKGVRNDGNSCPCGSATGHWVGIDSYRPDGMGSDSIPTPRAVRLFVRAFDDGRLPQYDKNAKATL